jgi:hypothetical protein
MTVLYYCCMANSNAPRNMLSKYRGKCTACAGFFEANAPIIWTRGAGAKHAVCPSMVIETVGAIGRDEVEAPTVVAVGSVVAFLKAARERGLKAPKARFLSPTGGELRLSMAGGSTKYPGAVQVKVNDNWIGRILADGTVAGPMERMVEVLATLEVIVADPAAAAAAYGALMGKCSFCNLPLTDAGSVEVGYGYVCAKRYGLPHKTKGVRVLDTVPTASPEATV